MQIYVVRLLRELDALEGRAGGRACNTTDRACHALISNVCAKLESVVAVCKEELGPRFARPDAAPPPALGCAGTSARRLVPSSRQQYTRYWASKVCL